MLVHRPLFWGNFFMILKSENIVLYQWKHQNANITRLILAFQYLGPENMIYFRDNSFESEYTDICCIISQIVRAK